ncbi:MFS transporter [Duganella sp. CY15W]|uniref:MFS transporter n=1 Tax=Duganella sp. CY15W TaxID=2692172 RepID=UPI00136F9ED9|nr:MFS transporter [Duganella sp. CY15W]MYM28117.1 MFS transporter [Duganella sp. CY15W]
MANTTSISGSQAGVHEHHQTSPGARNINARDGHISPGEIAIGVVIGRASEYFDFFVYAIASALVFPSVFFPYESRLDGTLYAFAIFALAFIARPLGTVAFMAVQHHFTREAKLTLALLIMGVSTAGIAFLPDYASLGTTSLVILSVLRVGQGIAQGGSWDGLPSLLALNAPEHKRGWYAMLGQLGAPIGFLIAAGLFSYMLSNLSSLDFLDWGWRYPFYVAFAINVVALFARLRLVTTHEYTHLLDEHQLDPVPVGDLMRSQGRNVVIGALAALASYALFHLVTVFPLSWITLTSQRSLAGFLQVQMVGVVLMAIGIIISGLIADRVGRRRTLGTLATCIAIFSFSVPYLIGAGEAGQDAFVLLGFSLLGLSYGQAAGAVTANFPQQYRYTGAALTSDLAWLVGAGFAPLVALGVSSHFGLAYAGLYLLSGAVSSLAALSINRAWTIRDN